MEGKVIEVLKQENPRIRLINWIKFGSMVSEVILNLDISMLSGVGHLTKHG
jgi:hypothetical protein